MNNTIRIARLKLLFIAAKVVTDSNVDMEDEHWKIFRELTQAKLKRVLKKLAEKGKLSAFRRHPRRPKKPVVKRKIDSKPPHVSTAKLIASRKK